MTRAIHVVNLDKQRPALVLTRSQAVGRLNWVTVAGITSTINGYAHELPVGERNGLDHESAVNLDEVFTVPFTKLGRLIGYLRDDQEAALHAALINAFDLDDVGD